MPGFKGGRNGEYSSSEKALGFFFLVLVDFFFNGVDRGVPLPIPIATLWLPFCRLIGCDECV